MSTINFNDSIYAQEALSAFVSTLTPVSTFGVDSVSTTTFSYSNNSGFPYEGSGGVVNTITVVLDQNFLSPLDLTDQQFANSSGATFLNFARIQGSTLGKFMLQRIWSLFTTVNFGLALTGISIGAYSRQSTVSIRTLMAKRDVPMDKLSLIVNEDVTNSLLNDSTIYQASSFGGTVAADGTISKIARMKFYETNCMPTNGISLVGVVAHPDGIALAMRYLEPQVPEAYVTARRMVDPSGLVMGYRRHYNPGRGTHYLNLECLFGMAVGISLGIGILQRAD